MFIRKIIFISLTYFLIFNLVNCINITLTNQTQILERNITSSFEYHNVSIPSGLIYDLVKIKIDSQYNGYVWLTIGSTSPYQGSMSGEKYLYNNSLIYFSQKTFSKYNYMYLGIYCEFSNCKYKLDIQGINFEDIELYDNCNFTLNSTVDRTAVINYYSNITDLTNNNILISILGTSVMDFNMTVKYNDIELNSYKDLPNGRNIILSSINIPSFSNSIPLKIYLQVPSDESAIITNRIIPIDNNIAKTNLNLYEEFTSYIGNNSLIKEECFIIQDKNSNNHNMMFSGYSPIGVYVFQANDNTLDEISNGKKIYNSDYYIFNISKSKTLCIKQINEKFQTSVHFQILDLSNIENGFNRTMRLIRGFQFKYFINKGQVISHPIDKIGIFKEKNMYLYSEKKLGNPRLFPSSCANVLNCKIEINDLFPKNSSNSTSDDDYDYCDDYPFYPECFEDDPYDPYDDDYGPFDPYYNRRLLSTSVQLSSFKPIYRYNRTIYRFKSDYFDYKLSTSYQYYANFGCDGEDGNNTNGCEYIIEAHRESDLEFLPLSEGNHVIKRYDGVNEGNKIYFIFSISDPNVKNCYVVLNSLSGNTDLSLFNDRKLSNEVGKYVALGNKEYYEISLDEGKSDLIGTYYISVYGSSNSFFNLQYFNTEGEIKKVYVNSGNMEMGYINFGDKEKIYTLVNKEVNISNKYLFDMNILNCELKVTFNNKIYSNQKHIQVYVDEDESFYSKGEYDINIELLELENGRNNSNENCIFYVGGFELNENKNISLIEGVSYPFTLTKNENKLNLVYRFLKRKISKDTASLAILIDKIGKGNLKLKVTNAYNKDKTLTISDRNNFRTLMIKDSFYDCEDTLCYMNMEVEYLNPTNSNLNFEIEIMGSNSVPYYLPTGELFLDILREGQYQYFYSDLKTNSYGEIIVNFKQGSGSVIGKIVNKNDIDEKANWNKRVKLPLIEDLEKNVNDKLIEFDYYNKKLVFTEEDTKNCDEGGCEIYIGILPYDEPRSLIYTPYIDYSIFLRYDDTSVEIPQNEYVFGSLKRTIDEDEVDYFIFNVNKDTDRIVISFDSDLCSLYVKKGKNKPNIKNKDYDREINGNDKIYVINAEYGDSFSFAVSTKYLDGYYNAFYTFKVMVPDIGIYPIIQEVESNQNEYCVINSNNNKCLFLIPLYTYRDVDDLYFYAINVDYPENNEIKINYIQSDSESVENNNNLVSSFPNTDNVNSSNLISIHLNVTTGDIEKVYLITVTSENEGKILFLTNMQKQLKYTSLRPNSKQLFYVTSFKRSTTFTTFSIRGNDIYYTEIVALNSTGNVTLITNKNVTIDSTTNNSIASIIKPKSENNTNITVYGNIEGINLLFYFKYELRSPNENLDEIENRKYQTIIYSNRNGIDIFPISLFLPITSNMNEDIIFNFNINTEINDDIFNIKSYIVDQDFILERKRGKNPSMDNFIIGGNDFNKKNLNGFFSFANDIISSSINKYIYLVINNTKYKYDNITLYLQKIIPNKKSENQIESTISKGEYTPLILHKSKINSFKLEKENSSDKIMKIEISQLIDYKIIFRGYDNSNIDEIFNSGDSINQNVEIEKEIGYGKQLYLIKNIDKYLGIFAYIIKSNKRFLQNDKEKNYNYINMKYNSYENDNDVTLINYNISNSTLTVNNNDSYISVIINPIYDTKKNKNIEDSSFYTVNLYKEENVEGNEESLNSTYLENNPYLSFSNGTYKEEEEQIHFDIDKSKLSENETYYIQVIAEIENDSGETEKLSYNTISYKYSKQQNPEETEESGQTEQPEEPENPEDPEEPENPEEQEKPEEDPGKNDNNDSGTFDDISNNNNHLPKNIKNKTSKNNDWKIAVIIICVLIVVVGFVLFIFRRKICGKKINKNIKYTDPEQPVNVELSEKNENDKIIDNINEKYN